MLFSNLYVLLESKSNKNIYFLSQNNMDNKTLSPRVPNNFLVKNGFEDSATPRVCFAPSIDKSLIALSRNLKGEKLYVHVPMENVDVYKPSIKEVPDSKVTGELWCKEKVKIKCIGMIEVIDATDDEYSYTYGTKYSAELYGWDWKWIKKY